jgi:AGZA family xanthine/uracil permease-like MFS transporter
MGGSGASGHTAGRYGWARWGDVNAFFGLMLDNVAVMIILVTTISSSRPVEEHRFSQEFVLTHMIPGTALGVLFGDLVYTWMAFRLARRSGRPDVTAMPLGLDTPSTFGVAFFILMPVLEDALTRLKMDHATAMLYAWHVGAVVLVLSGVFKVLCAGLGNAVRRWLPRAGLLGSLAAIALALIAFLPLMDVAAVPLVGVLSLTVILVTLVAHRALPGHLPGALAAVVLGVVVYHLGGWLGRDLGWPLIPPAEGMGSFAWQPPDLLPDLDWAGVWRAALAKLPIALPLALATVVGGIDCTESAAAAGDEYDTRTILLTEGVGTVLAGFCGGVIQTTPYIGHPAYKAMGGRAAYTLATALFIGAAGYFGWFTHLFELLPKAAMFPILVFVGLEITAQSFRATPTKHYPALALAALPALAKLVLILVGTALGSNAPSGKAGVEAVQVLRCLAGGFIITSVLWASSLAMLLDGRLKWSAAYLLIAGVFALFGVIHSPLPEEPIAPPWEVVARLPKGDADEHSPAEYQTPYHWAAAYGLAAALLFGLAFFRDEKDVPAGTDAGPGSAAHPPAEEAPGDAGRAAGHV